LADGRAPVPVGQRRAHAGRPAGRDLRAAGLSERPSRHCHRQWTDAAWLAFHHGLPRLFERAVFAHLAIFSEIPPKTSFTVAAGTTSAWPVSLANRNPYQIELQRFVDCIRGRADPALLDADRAIEALLLSLATQRSIESFTST
jgi:hypothetical protein